MMPFISLWGMMLATAGFLHIEISGRRVDSARSGRSEQSPLRGALGRLAAVVVVYAILCVILATLAGQESLKTLRDGQWVLAGVYALPVVTLAGSVALLTYQMRALEKLECRPRAGRS